MDECRELTRQAFDMTDSQEIHTFLDNWIKDRFPADYFIG
jgi:hypothetical protein